MAFVVSVDVVTATVFVDVCFSKEGCYIVGKDRFSYFCFCFQKITILNFYVIIIFLIKRLLYNFHFGTGKADF